MAMRRGHEEGKVRSQMHEKYRLFGGKQCE